MDPPLFALLTIFSIVLSGVREAASWRSNEDRSDGYDLQRGPVFYEAYYPDNRGLPAPVQQLIPVNANVQRRYSDGANVLQKTRQTLDESYGLPYDLDSRQRRSERGFAGPYDWSSQPGVSSESFLLDAPKESIEPLDRNVANVEAEKVARQLKNLVESLRQEASSINLSERSSRLADDPTNFRRPYTRRNYEENTNSYPDERIDDSINLILSAVRNGALKISEAPPEDLITRDKVENMRVGTDDLVRRYRPTVVPDGPALEESRAAVWGGRFGRPSDDQFERTSGDEYGDVRGTVSGMALGRMENIFQPRPQVISYVFSPIKMPAKGSPFAATGEIPQTRSIRSNERLARNDGENIIDGGVGKDVGRSTGTSAGVASIEVSEMPRHKIRHHHGEKPRREHQRRQAAGRN